VSHPTFAFTILIALSWTAVVACGRGAAPHEPVAAPAAAPIARPAPAGPPAAPGTRAHACPGIDQLERPRSRGPCTEMGCMNGFSITLYPNGGWPAGDYRFVIKHDGKTTTCEGRLPLKPCEEDSMPCDGTAAGVGASGCALPAGQQSFSNIGVDGYPATVDVEVQRDQVLLTRAHYDVAYTMQQPNGPNCDPICCSAPSGALTLPKAK